jgi:hypothetical protein
MPLLDEQQQKELLVPIGQTCNTCATEIRRNYCRQCDEFFFVCKCEPDPEDGHIGHRTY